MRRRESERVPAISLVVLAGLFFSACAVPSEPTSRSVAKAGVSGFASVLEVAARVSDVVRAVRDYRRRHDRWPEQPSAMAEPRDEEGIDMEKYESLRFLERASDDSLRISFQLRPYEIRRPEMGHTIVVDKAKGWVTVRVEQGETKGKVSLNLATLEMHAKKGTLPSDAAPADVKIVE